MSQELTLHAPQYDSQSQSYSLSSFDSDISQDLDDYDKENSPDDWPENSQVKLIWKTSNEKPKPELYKAQNLRKIKNPSSSMWIKKIPARKTIEKNKKGKRRLPKSFFQ